MLMMVAQLARGLKGRHLDQEFWNNDTIHPKLCVLIHDLQPPEMVFLALLCCFID